VNIQQNDQFVKCLAGKMTNHQNDEMAEWLASKMMGYQNDFNEKWPIQQNDSISK
jgi:hypothetical protein